MATNPTQSAYGSLGILSGLGAIFPTILGQNQALQESWNRYNQILQNYSNLMTYAGQAGQQVGGTQLNQLLNTVLGQYGAVSGDIGKKFNDILARYTRDQQARYSRAFDLVEGLGKTRAEEIARQYAAKESEALSELTSRGLGSTSILGSFKMGFEREKQRSLEELNEQLRQLKLNLHTGLTGEALSGQHALYSQYLSTVPGLLSQIPQVTQQLGTWGLGTQQQAIQNQLGIGQDMLHFMNSVSTVYPQQNYNVLSALGQAAGFLGI